MTKRKPLEWYDDAYGLIPGCGTCAELLFTPGFMEAVCSVAIEHAGSSPADLAKRTIDAFHANRHRDESHQPTPGG